MGTVLMILWTCLESEASAIYQDSAILLREGPPVEPSYLKEEGCYFSSAIRSCLPDCFLNYFLLAFSLLCALFSPEEAYEWPCSASDPASSPKTVTDQVPLWV